MYDLSKDEFDDDEETWTITLYSAGETAVERLNKHENNQALLTSSITQHIWWIHCVIASDVPVKVTARSVEFGNISLAT